MPDMTIGPTRPPASMNVLNRPIPIPLRFAGTESAMYTGTIPYRIPQKRPLKKRIGMNCWNEDGRVIEKVEMAPTDRPYMRTLFLPILSEAKPPNRLPQTDPTVLMAISMPYCGSDSPI